MMKIKLSALMLLSCMLVFPLAVGCGGKSIPGGDAQGDPGAEADAGMTTDPDSVGDPGGTSADGT